MKKSNYIQEPQIFSTIDEARQRYRLGRQALMRVAGDNEALVKIGKSVRINIKKLDKALENYYLN